MRQQKLVVDDGQEDVYAIHFTASYGDVEECA
jgi:hypothetical protein